MEKCRLTIECTYYRVPAHRLTGPMGSTEHFLVKGTLEERARDLLPITALDKELVDGCSLAYSLFFKFIEALAAAGIEQGLHVMPDGTPSPHEGIDLDEMHNLSSTLNLYDHIEHAYANMSDVERVAADMVVAVLLTVGVEALCKCGANIEFFAASLFLRRGHAYRDPRASGSEAHRLPEPKGSQGDGRADYYTACGRGVGCCHIRVPSKSGSLQEKITPGCLRVHPGILTCVPGRCSV